MIGAGFAGCAIAYALARQGWLVTVLDAGNSIAAGASGNTRCVIKPHQTRDDSIINRFWSDAFQITRRTIQQLRSASTPLDASFAGVLQLIEQPGHWATRNAGARVSSNHASRLAGIHIDSQAIYYPTAGWVNGTHYCQALLQDSPNITLSTQATVTGLGKSDNRWCVDVRSADGTLRTSDAHAVIAAIGSSSLSSLGQFTDGNALPLRPMSGHTLRGTFMPGQPHPTKVITGRGYIIPETHGFTAGASHYEPISSHWQSQDAESDNGSISTDTVNHILEKLHGVSPTLQHSLNVQGHWHGTRMTTLDRLPVVGGVPDYTRFAEDYAAIRYGPKHQAWSDPTFHHGLYLLSGLGSRGAVSAMLAAEILSSIITGQSDLATDIPRHRCRAYQALLHPARFLMRQLRRKKT